MENACCAVIDSHAHIGRWCGLCCDAGRLVSLMDAAGVGMALISDIGGNVLGADGLPLPPDAGQAALNAAALLQAERFPGRFRLLFWVRPGEAVDSTLHDWLRAHPMFVGLKTHPRYSGVPFDSESYRGYIELARALALPFCLHTENDGYADVRRLGAAAEAFPDVRFVAVHSGLSTDHGEAFLLAARLDNFYADTTLVPPEQACRGIEVCGASKVLFGSDAPALGANSYASLPSLRSMAAERFGAGEAELLFGGNAARVFRL